MALVAVLLLCLLVLAANQNLANSSPIQSRIVGGQDVTNTDFSFFAYISAYSEFYNHTRTGGGFFITQQHVVTSARLILGMSEWEIRYGSNQFDSMLSTTDIKGAEGHLGYWVSDYYEDDIGIITLASPVNVRTASYILDPSVPLVASEGTAIGFGMTNATNTRPEKLQRTNTLLVVPNEVCGEYTNGQLIATNTHFCAFDPLATSALCTGDLGGPMVTLSGSVVGIASISPRMCDGSTPVAYTRLSLYIDWLHERITVDN